jgi:hypothetical protein
MKVSKFQGPMLYFLNIFEKMAKKLRFEQTVSFEKIGL